MNDNQHLNDRDLEALAAEIDRLAFSDRQAPGLEGRVVAATLPVLQSSAASRAGLRLVGTPAVAKSRVAVRTSSPMRVAAGFALLATALVTIMAGRPGSPVGVIAPATVTDDWAIMSSVFEDKASKELDDIYSATSNLNDSIDSIGASDQLEEGVM